MRRVFSTLDCFPLTDWRTLASQSSIQYTYSLPVSHAWSGVETLAHLYHLRQSLFLQRSFIPPDSTCRSSSRAFSVASAICDAHSLNRQSRLFILFRLFGLLCSRHRHRQTLAQPATVSAAKMRNPARVFLPDHSRRYSTRVAVRPRARRGDTRTARAASSWRDAKSWRYRQSAKLKMCIPSTC